MRIVPTAAHRDAEPVTGYAVHGDLMEFPYDAISILQQIKKKNRLVWARAVLRQFSANNALASGVYKSCTFQTVTIIFSFSILRIELKNERIAFSWFADVRIFWRT